MKADTVVAYRKHDHVVTEDLNGGSFLITYEKMEVWVDRGPADQSGYMS